jgi:hypothetical protein
MVKGRLDKSASTATGYCWLVWEKQRRGAPKLVWIPACRRALEREGDYDVPNATSHKAARLVKVPKLKVAQPKKSIAVFNHSSLNCLLARSVSEKFGK